MDLEKRLYSEFGVQSLLVRCCTHGRGRRFRTESRVVSGEFSRWIKLFRQSTHMATDSVCRLVSWSQAVAGYWRTTMALTFYDQWSVDEILALASLAT